MSSNPQHPVPEERTVDAILKSIRAKIRADRAGNAAKASPDDPARIASLREHIQQQIRGTQGAIEAPTAMAGGPVNVPQVIVSHDISKMRAEIDAALTAHRQVGQLNPRLPGVHNQALQTVKKTMRRSLTWYTRPLHHFQGAVIRALQQVSTVLENHDHALRQISFEMDRQASVVQDLRRQSGSLTRSGDTPRPQSSGSIEKPVMLTLEPSPVNSSLSSRLSGQRLPVNQSALLKYAQTGYKEIEGWMGDGLFPLLQICAEVQDRFKETGGAVEIGVHHGQFFIALNQLCKADEPSLAIDIFDAQHLNIDGSGIGSLAKFKANLAGHCCHQGGNVKILAADSTSLSASEILSNLGMKPRFFSVDGGHTVEHLLNDLSLANDCISDFGVIFVDDFLHPDWLGVTEGVCRYLMRSPTILPFAINSNKLFLCRLSAYQYYLQAFSEYVTPPHPVEFFGKTVLVW